MPTRGIRFVPARVLTKSMRLLRKFLEEMDTFALLISAFVYLFRTGVNIWKALIQ